MSTRERKRAAKAMPPPVELASRGCALTLVGYLLACVALYWVTEASAFRTLALLGFVVLGVGVIRECRGRLLLAEARRVLQPRGIRCLLVHSDSPTWQDHIRDTWLPRLGERATSLNWSERDRWPKSLEVRLFNHFVGGSRLNFNPAVLVFRGLRRPLVFRFYYAFQQAKHGRPQYLEGLEAQVFQAVEREGPLG
jgi:hypothetical protein